MVNGKLMRKVLACALSFSLVLGCVLVADASSMGSSSSMGGSTTESSSSSHKSSSKSSGGGSASSSSSAVASQSSVVVGGKTFASTITGSFSAPNVNGSAVISAKADVNAAMGLKNGETASVRIFKSNYGPKAQKCVADTAAALNVTTGPVVDINLGKIAKNGKYENVQHINAPVVFTIGIPASFANAGSNFYMINVQPGGAVALLQDMDTDPNTITFATADFGVFALARQ